MEVRWCNSRCSHLDSNNSSARRSYLMIQTVIMMMSHKMEALQSRWIVTIVRCLICTINMDAISPQAKEVDRTWSRKCSTKTLNSLKLKHILKMTRLSHLAVIWEVIIWSWTARWKHFWQRSKNNLKRQFKATRRITNNSMPKNHSTTIWCENWRLTKERLTRKRREHPKKSRGLRRKKWARSEKRNELLSNDRRISNLSLTRPRRKEKR